jgi:RHS repeat-associated protein
MKRHLHFLIPVFIFSLLLSAYESAAQTNVVDDAVELAVLKKFYDSLGGNNSWSGWPLPGQWPTTVSSQLNTWSGLQVTNGDVTKIAMSGKGLAGRIPSNIGDLQKLNFFDLNTNAGIIGKIPVSLGTVNTLSLVQLYHCNLSGPLPAGIFNLPNLSTFNVAYNQLTGGIPSNVGNATALTNLTLFSNPLGGSIPLSITNLVNLTVLNLGSDQLVGTIPDNIGNLNKLTSIILSANNIEGAIPSSFGNLTALVTCNLSVNKLKSSIAMMKNFTHLNYLYLNNNQLYDSIPYDFFSGMNGLLGLSLSTNKFIGKLPVSIGNLSALSTLNVSFNQFTGALPSTFAGLVNISAFYAESNQLSGDLPANLFTGWTKLTTLTLRQNMFTGPFPSSISNCAFLTYVRADFNRFTSLPSTLNNSNMSLVNTIIFNDNELSFIPNFASQPNHSLLVLTIGNNRLDFSRLEPIVGNVKTYTFSPLKTINDVTQVTLIEGSALTLTTRPLGNVKTVVWEKQNSSGVWTTLSDIDNNDTYTVGSATANDEGVYRWTIISNSLSMAGLVVQSDPIKVKTPVRIAIDNWAFQYKYDGRKRMTHKKVPGADWVYMVYDDRDRLVLTQDGNQRTNNKWSFTKYDALNRPIMTGVYTHNAALDQAGMSSLISTTNFYEMFTGVTADNATHGYSNTVFPKLNDAAYSGSLLEMNTVTYYDNYNFKAGWGADYNYASNQLASVTENEVVYSQPASEFSGTIGQVTGTKMRTLETEPYLLQTVNYYDDKYRLIQSVSDNMKDGYDRTTTIYDFVGKVLSTKTTQTLGALTWTNVVNAITDGSKVTKAGSGTWGTSGASSVQQIPAGTDGWIETTVSNNTSARVFGLSDQDTDQNYPSIDYGFYMNATNLSVAINGTFYTVANGEKPGDRLRIAREGGNINFYRNGIKVYPTGTTTLSSSTILKADVALLTTPTSTVAGASVSHTRMSVSVGSSQSVARVFTYDHVGRLLTTTHSLNGATPITLIKNEYNELGQLVDKKLHSTDGTSFKQSIDYRYNIRGWLTSINDSQLMVNANNDETGDLFGMNLAYNESIGTGNGQEFNGNISGIKWNNNLAKGTIKERAYNFGYDPMNRLLSATHKENPGAWTAASSYHEDNLSYDLNGNIKTLNRKGSNGLSMDVLSYNYGTGDAISNQLQYVSDAGDPLKGFADGNVSTNDYTYDANGNMIVDLNKDLITSAGAQGITYNYLNLPDKVVNGSGDYIKYIYDATGRKLSQQVYDVSNVLKKKTDYMGEYYYENDTLKFINHEEGRIVMTIPSTPEYQYHLKDHLGNVRTTFTSKVDIVANTATLEETNKSLEQSKFLRYELAKRVNSILFDHTNGTATGYAVRLNGTANERNGLAYSLSVMPGDTIRMEAYAKYVDPSSINWTAALNTLMTQVLSGTAGVVIDGASYQQSANTPLPLTAIDHSNEPGTAPKAYINYIFVNREYDLNSIKLSAVRMTESAKENGTDVPHEKLVLTEIVKEPGYVYIYLSNDNLALGGSQIEVYFDDFKVTQTKSPIVASESFYPFGLTFDSSERENSLENKYLYNQGTGEKSFRTERVYDLGLNVDQSKLRTYDYITGRWWQVDPLSEVGQESWSVYQYSYNNPVRFSDPNGDCPMCLIWAAAEVIGTFTAAEVTTGAAVAAGGATAIVLAKKYGSKVLDAMGNASPYSTPAVDWAKSGSSNSQGNTDPDKKKKQEQLQKNKEQGAKGEEKSKNELKEGLQEGQEILDKPRVVTEDGRTTYPDHVVVDSNTKEVVLPQETKTGNAPLSPGQSSLQQNGGTIQSNKYPEYSGSKIKPKTLEVKRQN